MRQIWRGWRHASSSRLDQPTELPPTVEVAQSDSRDEDDLTPASREQWFARRPFIAPIVGALVGALVTFILTWLASDRAFLRQRVDEFVDQRIGAIEERLTTTEKRFAVFEDVYDDQLLGLRNSDSSYEAALQSLRVDFRQLECSVAGGRWIINAKECASLGPE